MKPIRTMTLLIVCLAIGLGMGCASKKAFRASLTDSDARMSAVEEAVEENGRGVNDVQQRLDRELESIRAELERVRADASGPATTPASPRDATFVPRSEHTDHRSPDRPPVYEVWFGTNRKPDPAGRGFSGESDDRLHYGSVVVQIPKSHRFGSTGSSWFVRLINWDDDRLKIEKLEIMTRERFYETVQGRLASQGGKRTALVYIHGYNTSFDRAAIQAAQIGYDLKVEGVTAFYSWPSRGESVAYAADEATVGASELYLEEFLRDVVARSGAEQIDVIAHSMGNRIFLRTLERLADDGHGKIFNQIILAAPDVDERVFRNLAHVYPTVAKRTTLYVSEKDRALSLSSFLHDYPRAGYAPPITVVPGIDTVEVTDIDLTLLGHGYVAEAEPVLHDMFNLLRCDQDPGHRQRLVSRSTSSDAGYWSMLP